MTRRTVWTAIVVGLALTSPARHQSEPGGSLASARRTAGEVQRQLLEWNPLLGPGRSGRIARAVLRCEREQGLASDVVLAVMKVESSVRPSVRSRKGAVGLMQVMPHMFEKLELPGAIGHIETNVEAGCMLLADNIRRLGEDQGISAYFWGSRIGGDGYLRRVQAVREELLLRADAEESRSRS